MKAGFSIKLILYFAPNCPRQTFAPNCSTPNCPRRIVRAELSVPNCNAQNCPDTTGALEVPRLRLQLWSDIEVNHIDIGRFDAFHPKGRGFESRSSRHVGTLGKSFTRSYLWQFGVKLRHSIRAVGSASE